MLVMVVGEIQERKKFVKIIYFNPDIKSKAHNALWIYSIIHFKILKSCEKAPIIGNFYGKSSS